MTLRGLAGAKLAQWARLVPPQLLEGRAPGECPLAATSMDIAENPVVRGILGSPIFHSRFTKTRAATYLGWGRKRSGRRAVELAKEASASFLLLEDGFLRSIDRRDPAVSIVVDDLGCYYDASAPSRLEQLVRRSLSPDEEKRAGAIMAFWREHGLSKYNGARERDLDLPPYVLVVDQVAGDLSIACGKADRESFSRMLEAALSENPELAIVVKIHPDARATGKTNFDLGLLAANPRIIVIDENVAAAGLIARAEKVYTVTSQMGFEALIHGKEVRCFGMPFYAGWGLTADALPTPYRRKKVTLEQLVHAALVEYTRYFDHEKGQECSVEEAMEGIALRRRMQHRFPPRVHALGFSAWKRPLLQKFLAGSEVIFVKKASEVPEGANLAIWGANAPAGLARDLRLLHVEDGFLRSSGLGADLVQPISWVIDGEGIYYDATRTSGLERILQESEFSPEILARAARLRADLVALGITKYNLGGTGWQPKGRGPVILVPGQVESDASIRLGARGIRTNLDLLKAVRAANPGAHIVYKPHPDVAAGLRPGGCDEAASWCDEIVTDVDTAALLGLVDEVHVMTSLMGFEALLRGVKVTCYGSPFYSGWGLTTDLCENRRRNRKISLDHLVAGTLIEYPSYVSRKTGAFITAEEAMAQLVSWRNAGPSRMKAHRKLLRAGLQAWAASGLRRIP